VPSTKFLAVLSTTRERIQPSRRPRCELRWSAGRQHNLLALELILRWSNKQRHDKISSQVCELDQSGPSLLPPAAGGPALPSPRRPACGQAEKAAGDEGRAPERISGELGCGEAPSLTFQRRLPIGPLSGIFNTMFAKRVIAESPLGRAGCSFWCPVMRAKLFWRSSSVCGRWTVLKANPFFHINTKRPDVRSGLRDKIRVLQWGINGGGFMETELW